MLTIQFVTRGRALSPCALALAIASTWLFSATAHAQTAAPAAAAPNPAPVASPGPAATPAPPVTATSAAPAPAAEEPAALDTNHATMNHNLSLFGAIGYSYGTGYGLGARFQLIFADHVLKLPPGKHDEFGVEFGLDYYHVSYDQSVLGYKFDWSYNEFTPVVGFTWNFWLSDKFMVYPKIDLGYRFISFSNDLNGYDAGVSHIYFQGTGGVAYDVGPVKLRAELGWASVRLGVGVPLF